MTPEKILEVCERAIQHYGPQNQQMKLLEEMAELSQEVCKFAIGDYRKTDRLIEETADVYIMIMQASIMLGRNEVFEAIHKKIERLEQRLIGEGIARL